MTGTTRHGITGDSTAADGPTADGTTESSTATRRRPGPIATTIAAGVLVLSLGWWGWFATEQARAGWWDVGQHVGIGPDARGWAQVDNLGVGVRLQGVEALAVVDEEQPPAGFAYLALDLEVVADGAPQSRSCTVQVRDARGRLFEAGREVPYADPYVSLLECGSSDPEEPVPAEQSMLVLVPVDAELVSVRVDAIDFPPARFIELPVP